MTIWGSTILQRSKRGQLYSLASRGAFWSFTFWWWKNQNLFKNPRGIWQIESLLYKIQQFQIRSCLHIKPLQLEFDQHFFTVQNREHYQTANSYSHSAPPLLQLNVSTALQWRRWIAAWPDGAHNSLVGANNKKKIYIIITTISTC